MKVPFNPKGLSRGVFNIFNLILIVLFLSRFIFDLVTTAVNLQVLVASSTVIWVEIVIFLIYFCWDICPAILVIILFWNIPKTGDTVLGSMKYQTIPRKEAKFGGGLGDVDPLLKNAHGNKIWENESRYDSDDENTGSYQPRSPGSSAPPNWAQPVHSPYKTTSSQTPTLHNYNNLKQPTEFGDSGPTHHIHSESIIQ